MPVALWIYRYCIFDVEERLWKCLTCMIFTTVLLCHLHKGAQKNLLWSHIFLEMTSSLLFLRRYSLRAILFRYLNRLVSYEFLLQASMVHTTETIRIRYFMDLLMAKKWPVMLVGNAGTGKSVLMVDKLDTLNMDDFIVQAVPFNFYTTSAMLQCKGTAWRKIKNLEDPQSLFYTTSS